MQKLYLDCDGVILDTISRSYKMLKEEKITGEENVAKFYSNIDWKKLIEQSGQINNSISKIKELSKYFDIEILTHVNSEREAIVKRKYFNEEIPCINVITVPKQIKKADFVNAKNTILVDDYSSNLEYWESKGGIGVKFAPTLEKCEYTVITNLLELIDIFIKDKVES